MSIEKTVTISEEYYNFLMRKNADLDVLIREFSSKEEIDKIMFQETIFGDDSIITLLTTDFELTQYIRKIELENNLYEKRIYNLVISYNELIEFLFGLEKVSSFRIKTEIRNKPLRKLKLGNFDFDGVHEFDVLTIEIPSKKEILNYFQYASEIVTLSGFAKKYSGKIYFNNKFNRWEDESAGMIWTKERGYFDFI